MANPLVGRCGATSEIDFRTDSSEKVFPMVAAGASNDDIQVHPLQRGGAK